MKKYNIPKMLTSLILGGCSSLLADYIVDYSGPSYTPISSPSVFDETMVLNVNGDTNQNIVVLGPVTINQLGGDALVVNYTGGNTRTYLSSLGSEGTIYGNIRYNITGGSFNNQTTSPAITEAVIGTSYGGSNAVVHGDVLITIEGGDFHGNIFGGGGATVKGSTILVINGGTFIAEDGIFGGNSWGGSTEGNATLKITAGDFSEANIFAGSHRTGPGFDQNEVLGTASVIIEGGTFRDINGGSTDGRETPSPRTPGKIVGNSEITINAKSEISITGDIHATSGVIDGNTVITFAGDADNLNFEGSIYLKNSESSELSGNAIINFGNEESNFVGTFNGVIQDEFDQLSVNGSSAITFSEAFSVKTLLVSVDSTVELVDGTLFGQLSVVFSEAFDQGEIIPFNLSDIFGSSTYIAESMIQTGTFTVFDGNNQEWRADYADGEIIVIAPIPEPVVYPILFGILAVGFTAVRRRKFAKANG